MAEAIPRNSNEACLITSHKEKNELVIWQLDKHQIHRGDDLVGFARDIKGGCPEWICSAGKGSVYLVSGKSPQQVVWKLGVVASNPENVENRRAHISLEFSESKRVGITEIRGLACIPTKSPNQEDILIFNSWELGSTLVAKTASTMQTLWRIARSERDFILVKSMCVDPKRGLLYTVHDCDINDQKCNVIQVYDAERARFSHVLTRPFGERTMGAEEIALLTVCQDSLVFKVLKDGVGELQLQYDTIIKVHEPKYTREP